MRLVVLVMVVLGAGLGYGAERPYSGALPQGDNGIAAKHPGDEGIDRDPGVVFVDGFEGGVERSKWNHAVWREEMKLATEDPANVHRGKKSAEFTLPKGSNYGLGATVRFKPGFDILFVRYYAKFDKADEFFNPAHDGACIAGVAEGLELNSPGVKADGKNKFMASMDTWRWEKDGTPPTTPGEWLIYCYHPEQKGGFGDNFYPQPKFMVQKDRWYCCELMLKANTPGQRDGRTAFWVDGRLIGDFGNLRLRDVDTLKINYVTITLYISDNRVKENRMWYDDVVMGTSYIGPTFTGKATSAKAKETGTKAVPPPGWGTTPGRTGGN